MKASFSRRQVVGGLGSLFGASLGGLPAFAQNAARTNDADGDEYLIQGGYVVPVDPNLRVLPRGDVHIRAGTILAVGENLAAPDATVIDASEAVVLPGFVETHWHMWTSLWRGMVDGPSEYFRLQSLRADYTVEDHYTAVLYAAMEAIDAGITTCHNWAHGVRNFADAEAEMQALADAGIRARMGYSGVLPNGPTPAGDFDRALSWISEHGQGRLSLGMLLDGAEEYFRTQVELARRLGLKTITDHGGFLAHSDLLGPEFLYTHGTGLTDEQIALIARHDVKVGLCPGTDPMIGAGLPPVHRLLSGGVPLANLSFTVDVNAQAPVDPFGLLRTLVNAGRIQQAASGDLLAIAQANHDWVFSYRDALELGTLSGANVLGLAEETGSLTPGKRADVIIVRMNELNALTAADSDPVMQLIQHGAAANVDTVFVDGRIRKRAGRLQGLDVEQLIADAATAQAGLRRRAALAEDRFQR